jgi:hypothetical protein
MNVYKTAVINNQFKKGAQIVVRKFAIFPNKFDLLLVILLTAN